MKAKKQNRNIVPTKERIRGIVIWWKNTKLFHFIDQEISVYKRKQLKNDQFTILSSNCIAGVIYHRLGKQFLTPTINMFFSNCAFVEFCVHLDWYLNQELRFIKSERPYPVAQLPGDGESIPTITLYFNHDKVNETAQEKWESRKQRIKRDNLYIILYNLDGLTAEHIAKLETVPCKNKVILTSLPMPDVPWSIQIKPIMTHRYPYNYLEKDMFGVRYFEKKFDYVSFLNT